MTRSLHCVFALILFCGGGVGVLSAESLFKKESFRSLAADNKAYRVGDSLTVQVVENASATANADTGTQRRNNLGLDIRALGSSSTNRSYGLDISGEFDGGGRTARTGKLLAQLTVVVKEILANGDMRIAGEQLLMINGEQQRINLEGKVRLADIATGNLVMSSRIADAKITYVGEGELSERQRKSWLRKIADWLGF